MANPFESAVTSLLEAGEPLSAVVREFGSAIGGYDPEIRGMIWDIADVMAEGEPVRRYSDEDDLEDEEDED